MSNYSPSRRPQSFISLFRAPNREQLENISNRRHSPISTLNDDTLLNIFYIYRLHCLYIRDEDEDTPLGFIRMWKLAQVSRRWRGIIFAFPSLLDLHLVCTYRVHVTDMLARYPPFPLAIFYNERLHEMTEKDEEGAHVALSHRDRVHRISLTMPRHKLEKITNGMDGQFPTLERLDIVSSIPIGPKLILPQTFDAPNLRHIYLRRVTLSLQCPLFTTTTGLVFLRLEDDLIPASFSPSYLLTQLSFMPQLETLRIGSYYSPPPDLDIVHTPTMTHVTLPNLRAFSFQGLDACLEDLLSRMSAPALSNFLVRYFHHPTFSVSRLLPFMQTSENLGSHAVKLIFNCDSFHLQSVSGARLGQWKLALEFQTRCRLLHWQGGPAAVQILSTLSPILSVVVEKVEFIVNRDRSSGWYDYIDRTEWREFFRPFNNVKALRVETDPKLIWNLSHSLRSEDGELPLELLPNLEELSYSRSYIVDRLTPFINDRQAVGHPVRLRLCCPMLECDATFKHSRDVEHHVVACHLPYAFFCPIPPCHWRGSRRDEYDVHYRIQHPEYDKHEPGQTYDNAAILRSIFEDGITYKTAECHALDIVAEKARELGMVDELKDLCGRRVKGGRCRCDLPVDRSRRRYCE